MTTTTTTQARTLRQTDRCDRCEAAARVLLTAEWGELMLCGHHYNEHADALFEAGVDLAVDNRL